VLQQQGQKFGSGSSNAHGTSILTNQEQQQQQQQQIPDVLLPLLPQWALLQVELLLLADLPAFKFVLLDSLNFMLQLLKCLQLSKQQYAWAPTVQALSQPVLLQLLPHMEQFAKEQHAAIAARAASSSSSSSGGGSSSAAEVVQLDASMVDDTYGLLQAVLLELASGGTFLAVAAANALAPYNLAFLLLFVVLASCCIPTAAAAACVQHVLSVRCLPCESPACRPVCCAACLPDWLACLLLSYRCAAEMDEQCPLCSHRLGISCLPVCCQSVLFTCLPASCAVQLT
jgi:hypothetical protein